MQSFQSNLSGRRKTFLRLAGDIESQLRDAYDRRYRAGEDTQASIADKLGINRSAVHHRLTGRTNMRTETIADMVWALGCKISILITDAAADTNHPIPTSDQKIELKSEKEMEPPKPKKPFEFESRGSGSSNSTAKYLEPV